MRDAPFPVLHPESPPLEEIEIFVDDVEVAVFLGRKKLEEPLLLGMGRGFRHPYVHLPSSPSSLAIAWISSMCFVSICAKRANTCLANGSALLSAAAVKSRFPSLSNRNARIHAPAGPLFSFAGPVFGIFSPPWKKTG